MLAVATITLATSCSDDDDNNIDEQEPKSQIIYQGSNYEVWFTAAEGETFSFDGLIGYVKHDIFLDACVVRVCNTIAANQYGFLRYDLLEVPLRQTELQALEDCAVVVSGTASLRGYCQTVGATIDSFPVAVYRGNDVDVKAADYPLLIDYIEFQQSPSAAHVTAVSGIVAYDGYAKSLTIQVSYEDDPLGAVVNGNMFVGYTTVIQVEDANSLTPYEGKRITFSGDLTYRGRIFYNADQGEYDYTNFTFLCSATNIEILE